MNKTIDKENFTNSVAIAIVSARATKDPILDWFKLDSSLS